MMPDWRVEKELGAAYDAQQNLPEVTLSAGSSECPETFRLSSDLRRVERTVALRDGSRRRTSLPVRGVLDTSRIEQVELAALADAAFLQSVERPRVSAGAQKVRLADLFSGCGIMSLGVWEACRAIGRGCEPVVALDANPIPLRVYKENFPDSVVCCKPIEQVLDGQVGTGATDTERYFVKRIGRVDLLVGGPPCQGHSDLNNHTRRNDPKNWLYGRMARFAELVRPTHIIIENVSAVLHDRSAVVERTANELFRLGYAVDHDVAEVSLLGVAQRRRRHVMVASLERKPNVRRSLAAYAQEVRTVSWAIHDLVRRRQKSVLDSVGTPSTRTRERIEYLFRKNVDNLPNRLRPDCHRLKKHSYKSVYGRMLWDGPAQTVTSGFTSMGQGRYVHPKRRRTITPHEAARLQFIPDFFRFPEDIPRTALAEMIGNAVPTKLTYVVAIELLR